MPELTDEQRDAFYSAYKRTFQFGIIASTVSFIGIILLAYGTGIWRPLAPVAGVFLLTLVFFVYYGRHSDAILNARVN